MLILARSQEEVTSFLQRILWIDIRRYYHSYLAYVSIAYSFYGMLFPLFSAIDSFDLHRNRQQTKISNQNSALPPDMEVHLAESK